MVVNLMITLCNLQIHTTTRVIMKTLEDSKEMKTKSSSNIMTRIDLTTRDKQAMVITNSKTNKMITIRTDNMADRQMINKIMPTTWTKAIIRKT